MFHSRFGRLTALFSALFLAFSLTAVDFAEARRGGSFGSRGARTFQSAPPTSTAPRTTAPIERSATPRQQSPQAGTSQATRPGAGAFGSPLVRGLFLGGLFGLLMGYGFGGLAGLFGLLLQVLLIGGAIFLLMRLFRAPGSRGPVLAGASGSSGGGRPNPVRPDPLNVARVGAAAGGAAAGGGTAAALRLSQTDLDTFERRLAEVQDAFSREDQSALRRVATPEIVSLLSEELAENAKRGVVNEVSDVQLLQADIAESWREGDRDYATAAMRFESRDVTRDRQNGEVVGGEPDRPTEATELWTFVRERGGEWKLSAIQEVRA